jgi:hypothetical protein
MQFANPELQASPLDGVSPCNSRAPDGPYFLALVWGPVTNGPRAVPLPELR